MVFIFEITGTVQGWLWDRTRYLVWTVGWVFLVFFFFSFLLLFFIGYYCQLVGCCLFSQKCWMLSIPGTIQYGEESMVARPWAFAVGTWWCSLWRAVLVSIHCWRRWGLWRDARRCCARSKPDWGRAPSLSSRYFPRIGMSHDPKPSMTFMIYGWNAGRIFHSLLCVPSLCFYMKSVTPVQKNCYRCCWKPLF